MTLLSVFFFLLLFSAADSTVTTGICFACDRQTIKLIMQYETNQEILSFRMYFFFLLRWHIDRSENEIQRPNEIILLFFQLTNGYNDVDWARPASTGCMQYRLGVPHWWKDPRTLVIVCHFPWHISSRLDSKWSSWDLKWQPRWMLALQAWLNSWHHCTCLCSSNIKKQ